MKKKTLLSIVVCAVLAMSVFAFTGCSSSEDSDASSSSSSSSSSSALEETSTTSEADSSASTTDSSTAMSVTEAVGDLDLNDWDAVVDAAKDSKVTFYGYGADETFNNYMNGTVTNYLKENYNIDFEWVEVAKTDDMVTMVSDEKQAGSVLGEGATDLSWIGSFQFLSMRENGLLLDDIKDYIPNVKKYVPDDVIAMNEITGVEVGSMAVPWDPTEFVFIADTAKTNWLPKNADEFLDWCKEYKGYVTYPSTDNSYGKAVITMLMNDYLGADWYADLDENSTYDEVVEVMEPGLEYLRELNPYLWNEGQTYPSTPGQQLESFAAGDLYLTVDWVPYSVGAHIKDGTFTDTTVAFSFDSGLVEDWAGGLIAIPYDCSNVPGALVTINALLTPELGYAMLDETGYPPAIDYNKLNEEEKTIADSVDVGQGSMTQEEVAEAHVVDFMPAWLVDTVDEIWQNEVAGKYNE